MRAPVHAEASVEPVPPCVSVPGGHGLHVALLTPANVLAGHVTHGPPDTLAVPAGQAVHESARPSAKPPPGQGVHAVAPLPPLVSEFSVQFRQDVEPKAPPRLSNVLTGQAAQLSATPSDAVPGAQSWQSNDELRPALSVLVPAGQALHSGEPGAVL